MKIKNYALALLAGCSLFQTQLMGFDPNEITYQTLATNEWTDHVRAFRCLFAVEKVSSFLEFGTGRGTKYFLDNCDHVTSIEVSTTSRNMTSWYELCVNAYKNYTNWTPRHYFASDVVDFYNQNDALEYYRMTDKYPTAYLSDFVKEIDAICSLGLSGGHVDLAFVDPGLFTRADFITCLFDKVDIIVTHDVHDPVYGWLRIPNHPNYEKIRFSRGCGVDFWIKKTRGDLIAKLKKEIQLHISDSP